MMQSESNISGLIYQLAKLQKYFLNQHLSNLDLNSDQATGQCRIKSGTG